jgi:trypsin
MRTPTTRASIAVCLLLFTTALVAQTPGAIPLAEPGEKLVNGVPVAGFPSVGLLLNSTATCTGTLIGCSTLLTAAHCICADPSTGNLLNGTQCSARADLLDPATKFVYFHHAGLFAVSSVTVNPGFVFRQTSDLAIVKLASPVSGIAPSPINTTGKPAPGSTGIIVGFGVTEAASSGSGIKRAGTLNIANCAAAGINPSNHVCATLSAPLGSTSGTCHGDSGGPLFVDLGSGLVIAGTTSGGDSPSQNCTPPNHLYFADVFKDRSWIAAVSGTDLGTAACGGIPAAGGPNTAVSGAIGALSPSHISDELTLAVPAGMSRLRVGLTAENFLANEFNLYVKRGGTPSTSIFDCKSDGIYTLAFCDIASPAADTWHFLVNGISGPGGPYELVTTLFAQSGTVPCVRDSETACLQNDRLEVNVVWNNSGGSGSGQVMSFGGQRTEGTEAAFYYFQSPTNFEIGVKVLNACIPAFGNKFWVFISGLTDQGWDVTIRDTQTGAIKSYSNPRGHLSTTFADTAAFNCS